MRPGTFRIVVCEKECPFGTFLGFHLGAFDNDSVVEQWCLKRTRIGRDAESNHGSARVVHVEVNHCTVNTLRRPAHQNRNHLHPSAIRASCAVHLVSWLTIRSTPHMENCRPSSKCRTATSRTRGHRCGCPRFPSRNRGLPPRGYGDDYVSTVCDASCARNKKRSLTFPQYGRVSDLDYGVKSSAQLRRWSRCETDASQTVLCTAMELTRAHANFRSPDGMVDRTDLTLVGRITAVKGNRQAPAATIDHQTRRSLMNCQLFQS